MSEVYVEDMFVLQWSGDLAFVEYELLNGGLGQVGYGTEAERKQAMRSCLKTGKLNVEGSDIEVSWFRTSDIGDMYIRTKKQINAMEAKQLNNLPGQWWVYEDGQFKQFESGQIMPLPPRKRQKPTFHIPFWLLFLLFFIFYLGLCTGIYFWL